MPSSSVADAPADTIAGGRLYVVATPIGNLRDITLRALDVLRAADLIAAEDTRHSGRLLRHFDIDSELISYHEHNERERTPLLLARIQAGATVALISDAGTPTVSDPGAILIRACVREGLAVVPVPGASALTTALSAAALECERFLFVGFTERKNAVRRRLLSELEGLPFALVFYESPKRIAALTAELATVLGNRSAVLCRELTKMNEEFIRAPLTELTALLADREVIKGECTLLVEPAAAAGPPAMESILPLLRDRLRRPGARLSAVVREIAADYQIPRRKLYNLAISLRDQLADNDNDGP